MAGVTRDTIKSPKIPIRLRDVDRTVDTQFTDYILEISKSRIFIRTKKPLKTGTQVHLEFKLKGTSRPVHLKGQVVRVSEPDTDPDSELGAGMGIKFQNISFDDTKLINDYLNIISNPEMGREYSHFLGWVKTLGGEVDPDEVARIKREWLTSVVGTVKGKIPPGPAQKAAAKRVPVKPREELDPLKKINLFEDLLDEELSQLSEICNQEVFNAGEKIFEEGAIGDKFYMILEGAVRISKVIPGVGEEALVVLKPGSYFGEMALIEESPRSASAICNEKSELLTIHKDKFEKLLTTDRDIAYKLLWTFVRTLSMRLRETNEKIKGFFAMTGGDKW